MKGFADDITIISSTKDDHNEAIQEISHACEDLNLKLNPPKCISFVFDGKKVDKQAAFQVNSEMMRNISSGHTKFLDHGPSRSFQQINLLQGLK